MWLVRAMACQRSIHALGGGAVALGRGRRHWAEGKHSGKVMRGDASTIRDALCEGACVGERGAAAAAARRCTAEVHVAGMPWRAVLAVEGRKCTLKTK